jgi:maltooligosyltrehalose trehalohydrolase
MFMNGATVKGNLTEFRVWAPAAQRVTVRLRRSNGQQQDFSMSATSGGVHELTAEAGPKDRYFYLLDDDPLKLPDPVSRYLPEGVHGPTEIVDTTSHDWRDQGWRGIEYRDYVIYELHVGTFTPDGTFESAIEKLDYLKNLGITAIELMPVAAFPGKHNWGYDGVSMYAVQASYGGPEGLKRLVDAAHERGLAVILDVVYNHLGNEGNYLGRFGPYFTSKHKTPWGDAINYDDHGSDHVRSYIVQNALYWIREYHIDGLRLDAVHTIQDESKTHILAEIRDAVQKYAAEAGRTVCLIAETDENSPRYVRPRAQGGYGFDGIWSDDFHHALHTIATGEDEGYYQDYGKPEQLVRALNEGFAFQGEPYNFWGRNRGESSDGMPAEAHVVCIQNHDQVGNRAVGERLAELVSGEKRMVMAALLLLSPATPLIWMGEESDETSPFQFFTDYGDPVLQKAVSEGRRNEFKHFKSFGTEFPDPQNPATFERSKLNWELTPERRAMIDWYRQLLSLRKWAYTTGERSCRAQLVGNMMEINIPASEPRVLIRAALSPIDLPSPVADWIQPIKVEGENARLGIWMPAEAAEQLKLRCA